MLEFTKIIGVFWIGLLSGLIVFGMILMIGQKFVRWVQIGSKFALRSATPYAKRLKLLVWKGGRVV